MSNKKIYVVSATTTIEGLVLLELFEDIDDALSFEKNGVKKQLRNEYSDKMADCPDLQIAFSTRIL